MNTNAASNHPQETIGFPRPLARVSDPPTLLVVDDDPDFRTLEAEVFSGLGYNVLQAASAVEALRLAAETAAIHLLVTDFLMPETNGLELARRFRAMHPETPVLMISGSLPQIDHKARDLGRFDLIGKPFTFDELLAKVQALLADIAPLPFRNL
jgi:CheY-like chemotaxis protein